jgi:hypothetical protein
MTQKQYEKYKNTIIKICGGDEKAEDLLHDILIQLSSNHKFNSLDEKSRLFFFIRTAQNQFYSNNSSFKRTYKKYHFEEIPVTYDPKEEEYKESPTMEWVKETLEEELRINKDFWYNKGIFELYLEHKRLEEIHRRTKIPKYSLRATLKEVKIWLNNKWIEYGKES